MRPVFAIVIASCLALGACKPSMIKGTNIEDTDENRAVIDFMEEYRTAIESRQSDRVLSLVAEEYFEDNGTNDQGDDYGLEKLQAELERDFKHTSALQLNLTIQHIEPRPDTDHMQVYYRYLQRALLELPAGNRWVSSSDVNRLILKRKGDDHTDGFLIVSGL